MSLYHNKQEYLQHLERLRKDLTASQIDFIGRAFDVAFQAHKDQKRLSGEDYIIHPGEVGYYLALWNADYISIASGLLHDVIEDTGITFDAIKAQFGVKTAKIIEGVTKITGITPSLDTTNEVFNFRKLIFALSEDIRVIIVKFADRIHNLKTLKYLPIEKAKKVAQESLDIYAPLANRLGMYRIKSEIEDLSFKCLNPQEYDKIHNLIGKTKEENEVVINLEIDKIERLLKADSISCKVVGRAKNYYSMYTKAAKSHTSVEKLFDILGIRIITDSVENCYRILGKINQHYKPLSNKYKDYITIPKSNNYQSIHTTYKNSEGKSIEAQIRTVDMDYVAEFGVAAHFLYKEGRPGYNSFDKQISMLREYIDCHEASPEDAFEHFKQELFKNEIYTFTPAGSVKFLPQGATVLDFAFYVHTDLGLHCRAAIVNGKFVAIDYVLSSRDTVKIITSSLVHPTEEWLHIAKTYKAVSKIKNYLKVAHRDEYIKKGEMMALGYFKSLNLKEKFEQVIKGEIKKDIFTDKETLFFKLGTGGIKKESLFSELVKQKEVVEEDSESDAEKKVELKPLHRQKGSEISIEGIGNIAYKIAKCCYPVPGDVIKGSISRGSRVIIHNKDCKVLQKNMKESSAVYFLANWLVETGNYSAEIYIKTVDNPGLLSVINEAIIKHSSNIEEFKYKSKKLGYGEGNLKIKVHNLKHLSEIMKAIEDTKSIVEVSRYGSCS